MSAATMPVLEGVNLVKHYPVRGGWFAPPRHVHALDGISLSLAKGETLAVVGESGCGKSTLARCLMRLEEPTAGRVVLDGDDITHATRARMRPLRRKMQIVFQDPYASLNPRWSIGSIVGDPIRLHEALARAERRARVVELADARTLRTRRLHPYSQALFSAAPVADPDRAAKKARIILAGDVPSPVDPPSGCRFRTRCAHRQERCAAEAPQLREVEGRW